MDKCICLEFAIEGKDGVLWFLWLIEV